MGKRLKWAQNSVHLTRKMVQWSWNTYLPALSPLGRLHDLENNRVENPGFIRLLGQSLHHQLATIFAFVLACYSLEYGNKCISYKPYALGVKKCSLSNLRNVLWSGLEEKCSFTCCSGLGETNTQRHGQNTQHTDCPTANTTAARMKLPARHHG